MFPTDHRVRHGFVGEITGRLLGVHLDLGVGWDQVVGDRNTFADLDALGDQASCFRLLMETNRSMRLMPSQWKMSGMRSWNRMSSTPATHSVRSK